MAPGGPHIEAREAGLEGRPRRKANAI
jgi:hypothetical protein